MHNYVIKLTRYSEVGALTSEVTFNFCDTPQQLSDKKTQYEKMRYTSVDEETGETKVGMKMYEVKAMQAEYVEISDWEAFCAMNKVLR